MYLNVVHPILTPTFLKIPDPSHIIALFCGSLRIEFMVNIRQNIEHQESSWKHLESLFDVLHACWGVSGLPHSHFQASCLLHHLIYHSLILTRFLDAMSFFRGLHGYHYLVGPRIKEIPWNNLLTWSNLLLITCIWILGWRSDGRWLNSEWHLCLVNTQLIQYQSEVNDISTPARRPFAASRHVESS